MTYFCNRDSPHGVEKIKYFIEYSRLYYNLLSMRPLILSSVLLLVLSSCTFGISSEKNTNLSDESTTKTDSVAKISPNEVKDGALVTLNYTLRQDSVDGKIIETTIEDVAKTNNLYKSGSQYQPFQVMIGGNNVIPGFEQGLIGMKKGEKKTITVSPELGYGTGPTIREIPKEQIAPIFSKTLDKELFNDTISQTVEKSQLRQDMQNAKVGDVFTGASNSTATVTAVDEGTITLAISNIDNPFYQKKLSVGATAEAADGSASFKITRLAGTGVTVEIINKQSPFFNKKFAAGESIDSPQGNISLQEIKDDSVVIAQSHPLMGKTLYFEVEVTDIQ